MKYYIGEEYGTIYWLDDDLLIGCPINANDTFDSEAQFVVERPHDEVPESYYESVIAKLSVDSEVK
jgi:hypothetical protein